MKAWNSTLNAPSKPMKRSSFDQSKHKANIKSGKKRYRKCSVKGCREQATTSTALVGWCSPEHGAALAEQALAKKKAREAKEERADDRKRREAVKTRSDWMKEAQIAFNAFIRERDRLAGHLCISSGRPLDWSGNNVDAGHYRSVGSAPHLRFDERNCHAQSKQDNRYGAGRAVDYRIGLIKRIGLEAVEAIEADQAPRKWSIDELKAIKAHYKAKLKELKAQS